MAKHIVDQREEPTNGECRQFGLIPKLDSYHPKSHIILTVQLADEHTFTTDVPIFRLFIFFC